MERVAEHVLRHARVHNQLASDDRYAGGIAWCAFDYNTHGNFGSGDRICYHGVSDIFRLPKAAAGFYKSQCDPSDEIVLEPGFFWSQGDRSTAGGLGVVPICSNCDHLKIFVNGRLQREADPDRATYGHLKYPPFLVQISDEPEWGCLLYTSDVYKRQAAIRAKSGVNRSGHTIHYFFNFSAGSQHVPYPYLAGVELLSGIAVTKGGELSLDPWGVAIVEQLSLIHI